MKTPPGNESTMDLNFATRLDYDTTGATGSAARR